MIEFIGILGIFEEVIVFFRRDWNISPFSHSFAQTMKPIEMENAPLPVFREGFCVPIHRTLH